jgi:hypothetical protein
MSHTDLYNQFYEIVQSGDEAKVRAFVFDHFKEFPESVQEQLTFAFFEEALTKESSDAAAVADFKAKGLEFLRDASKAKAMLEDEAKVADTKAGLGI